jgi:hypothetical protein
MMTNSTGFFGSQAMLLPCKSGDKERPKSNPAMSHHLTLSLIELSIVFPSFFN